MAQCRILYWQDIPTVVKAADGDGEVSLQLDPRFQERVDREAMRQGLAGTDDYLDHWQWSEPQERAGSAQEAAQSLKTELEFQLTD